MLMTQVQTLVGIDPWIISWESLLRFICSINSLKDISSGQCYGKCYKFLPVAACKFKNIHVILCRQRGLGRI